jgi:lipopolysaccharide export system permease protein
VALLLGYVALGHLPTMLALSLFVSVVVSLGRMYRDSEMAVWFASGVGLVRFVKPVLQTGTPVLVLIGLLILVAWPWGNRSSLDLRDRYAQRSDLSRVAPGVFQTSSDGRRVFFIERDSPDGVTAKNVFILSNQDGGESVTSARTGRLDIVGEDRFLVLERGQRNEVDLETGERSLSSFETYRVLAGERAVRSAQNRPPRAVSTLDLLRQATPMNQGELVWRLGILFAAANLLLLGVGLAATNPRRASNWNLLFALLAFLVYYNLVNLSQAWVASGRLSVGVALFALHGSVSAMALALLWWRDHAAVTRWLGRPGRPASTQVGA